MAITVWRSIRREADLPPIGTPEGETLDFKSTGYQGTPHDRVEIARDVAQFANAFGGTLLIGAREESGKIVGYVGVEDGEKQVSRIRDASMDLLAPRASVQIDRIPVAGGEVLSVNVEPSSPFLGLRVSGTDRWEFVVRRTDRKIYLSFEEVMTMVPSERRSLLLLRGIPDASRGKIRLDTNTPREANSHWGPIWKLEDIGDHHATLQNVATQIYVQFPLAFIEAVWPSDGYGEYSISAPVYLRRMQEDTGPRVYVTRRPIA